MADQYDQIRRAIASGNPLTVYMHREAMMTPLEGDVRELVRELDALREDAARMERNRDMWRGQCGQQVDRIMELRHERDRLAIAVEALIEAHKGNSPLGAALNLADAALHPSKGAGSGEVGNG